MFYLENNTTFSGSDIKVYAYRNASDFSNFQDLDQRKVKQANTDPYYPNDPFRNIDANDIDRELSESLERVASGKAQAQDAVTLHFADGSTKVIPASQKDQALQRAEGVLFATPSPDKINFDAVQTNKINPNYIDIVRQGSDKNSLKLARDYQLAQQRVNKNLVYDKDGRPIDGKAKPIIELGSLYSITYSSFREKHAVRTLGRVSAKAYTRGQRTIAGSMNFAVFQSHELMDFLKTGENASQIVLLDQLPKFNLMLLMINEYGGASVLHLFGVTISTESQQTSVEDLALMNNVTFYAEDIMSIENVGNIFETSLSMLHPTVIAGKTLRFYKKNEFTTLGSLMSINSDNGRNSKIDALINKSRGLF